MIVEMLGDKINQDILYLQAGISKIITCPDNHT
jgi:hypothetical protein